MKKPITMKLVLRWIKERNPAEELTSDNRLALYLGVSRQRLWNWLQMGEIPRPALLEKIKKAARLNDEETEQLLRHMHQQRMQAALSRAIKKITVAAAFFVLASLMGPREADAAQGKVFDIMQQAIHYTNWLWRRLLRPILINLLLINRVQPLHA